MTPENRNRIGLILIVLLFAAPIATAYLLNAAGWRPSGMRNYGTLIEPPQDLTAARFVLDDGKPLAWKDEDWSWTLIALTGPGCAEKCVARIDELRRVRLTLNQNAFRVRVVVLDGTVSPDALSSLKPVQRAHDVDEKLAGLRPQKADDVAAVLVDPHGFLVLSYPSGYDANLLRKDLARLIKG
jgi:cytochrome oxidase Cu insertion factor (SCO1/SenC/PrrC family)